MVWKGKNYMGELGTSTSAYWSTIILVHFAGYSIAFTCTETPSGFMKLTICNSQTHFPFCKIIWSQILPDNRYRDLIPYLVANEATNSSTIPSLC